MQSPHDQGSTVHHQYLQQPQLGDDELMQDSRCAFGIYRPEIKQIPDPLTFKEAKRKYRMQVDTLDDHNRRMKKLSNYKAIVKTVGGHERHQSQLAPGSAVTAEMGKYLGHRGGELRTRSKVSHTHKTSTIGMDNSFGMMVHNSDMTSVVRSIEMKRREGNRTQMQYH